MAEKMGKRGRKAGKGGNKAKAEATATRGAMAGARRGRPKATAAAAAPARRGRKPGRPAGAGRGGKAAAASGASNVAMPHTLATISRLVGVSATTIKYYMKQLPGLIEFNGSGRDRRFSERSLNILKDVRRRLSQEGMSLKQIRQELEDSPAPARSSAADREEAPARASSGGAGGGGSLEQMLRQVLSEVKGLRKEVAKLRR